MKKHVQTFMKLLLFFAFYVPITDAPAQNPVLVSSEVISQDYQAKEEVKVLLKDLLDILEESYTVKFAYDDELIRNKRLHDPRPFKNDLDRELSRILQPLKLDFAKIDREHYVIRSDITRINKRKVRSGPIINTSGKIDPFVVDKIVKRSEFIQRKADRSISGKVTGEDGEPLPGASVIAKGSTLGTVTDSDGSYEINLPDEVNTLVFSFIGYISEEVTIGSRNVIDIILYPDITQLSEVVVVGYGTQKKADVTGAVFRIKTDKTADLPNYNVLQSLQGRVPGLNITSPDRPGEEPGLSVRGTNSISAGNRPLVVVDGIIYNGNLSDFNANDIATVDVLKDASAAAVYGSRAANGVLLITTKSGTSEKPQFNFNTYHGIQEPDFLVDVLDGPGYLQKVLDFREANGLEADPAKIDEYLTVVEAQNRQAGITTDWMDRVIKTGVINNYHLDISGKSKNTNYYLSGTYFNQEGIVENDKFDRLTFNLNLTNHITDWYSVTVKTAFSSQDRSGRPATLTDAYRQSPYGNFYNENGPEGLELLPVGDPLGRHPLANTLVENEDIRTSLWGLFSSNLEVPFIPGLKWTMNYSANLRNSQISEFFDNVATPAGEVENGIATKTEQENLDWTFDNFLNYRKVFKDVHSLDVTFLYSRERQRVDFTRARGNNFFTQALGFNNLGLAEVQQVGSEFEDQNSVAYMGRFNYSYDGKYAITLTARRDGFSGFSTNNKYATFPSVALAWTVTNEEFVRNLSWLNYLKLRLSYGENGNQAVGRFQSLARIGTNQYVFGGGGTTTTTFVNSIANNNLTWETTTAKNIGIDFDLLNSKLSGSIDVYSSDTKDILLQRALPETSGFEDVLTNIGQVHNHGVEVSLNSINVKNENLSWETGVVFSLNRNRIDKLTGEDADGDGVEDDDIRNGWFIGESLFSIFGYKTNGIHQLEDSDIPAGFAPGDFRIVDTNNDGELSPEDRVILGNRLPNYTFSIANTLRFKNFALYVLVNSIQGGGNDNYYVGNNNATRNVNAPFTTFSERFNVQDVPYWTPSRPSNEYPRVDYNASLPHPILEDRSFVRIQDVSLSYTFDEAVLSKLKLNSFRLYVSAKNLKTFTNWSGYDPENATTLSNFPFLRSYTLGADFRF